MCGHAERIPAREGWAVSGFSRLGLFSQIQRFPTDSQCAIVMGMKSDMKEWTAAHTDKGWWVDFGTDKPLTPEQEKKFAILAAAAPELLEACELFVKIEKDLFPPDSCGYCGEANHEEDAPLCPVWWAQNAIAKARP